MPKTITGHIDQALLENVPLGLLLLDGDDIIQWANQGLGQMLGVDPANLVGRRLAQLPASAQDLLATKPQVFQDAERERWLRREVRMGGGEGERLLVLQDVTAQEALAEENARLRQQVEDLRLTDELTGLPNKRAISQALDLHVSRSRRYQNPLSAALVYVDVHAGAGEKPLSPDPAILGVSRFLRDRLRWVDQIARWDDSIFLLVLPETSESDARALLDKILDEQQNMHLPETYAGPLPRLSFGLASWAKGDDMRTLLRKVVNDLREKSGV